MSWLRAFRPAPVPANWRERLRVVVGAAVGIAFTALVSRALAPAGTQALWLVAPMGASAVLVFGVPASPLAQPWAVVAGNTLSALVGVACARWLGPPEWAAGVAVGGAVAVMFALRCLHPPGGATALLAVLGGITAPAYAVYPVLCNTLALVLAGMAYNRATGRAYPHMQLPAVAAAAHDKAAQAVAADLDAVLARHNQVLDISRDELQALLQDTKLQTYQRQLAGLRCSDIMSRQVITVAASTPLRQAWAMFREHRIKALPVVDAARGVVGIVTPADFMRAAEVADDDGFTVRLRKLQGWARAGARAERPGVVGDVMTRQVRVASQQRHLSELVPLFGGSGHHHIPIVDDAARLVGIVTQSDVVAALARQPSSSPVRPP